MNWTAKKHGRYFFYKENDITAYSDSGFSISGRLIGLCYLHRQNNRMEPRGRCCSLFSPCSPYSTHLCFPSDVPFRFPLSMMLSAAICVQKHSAHTSSSSRGTQHLQQQTDRRRRAWPMISCTNVRGPIIRHHLSRGAPAARTQASKAP